MTQLPPLPEMPDLTKFNALSGLVVDIYDWLNHSYKWVNSSAANASVDSSVSYLTVNPETVAFPQSRYLVGGLGITISDEGPGQALVISTPAITSVTGTPNQILALRSGSAVTLSLIGPYAPTTYAAHGVLIGQDTLAITTVAPGAAGTVLTSQGPTLDPIWSPAAAGGVTSVIGTANQIIAATASGIVTLSLDGPHNYTAQTAHGVLLGQGTSPITALAPGTSGYVLTSQGASSDPIWSSTLAVSSVALNAGGGTVTLSAPSSAFTNYSITYPAGAPTQGALSYYADAAGTLAGLVDVAAGSYLRSGGLNTAPLWSTLILPNAAAMGDIMVATSANTIGSLVPGVSGRILVSQGPGSLPTWNSLVSLGAVTSVTGTANQINAATAGGAVTLSLIGPYTPATYTAHGVLLGEGTASIVAIAPVALGQVFSSQGTGADPAWSATPTLTKLTVQQPISTNPALGEVMSNGNPVMQTTVAALPQYSRTVLGDTPAGYWRLGEASGNFADSSGNGNTGVVSGAAFTYAVAGAIQDDPNTAVTQATTALATVAAAASLPGGDTFSVEVWFKRTATQGALQYWILQKAGGFMLYLNSSNQPAGAINGGANFFSCTNVVTDTTTWHHFAFSKNGAARAGYLDGVLLTNSAGNQTVAPTDSTLFLMNNGAGTVPANQSLDEIAVWTTALSAAQVLAHYNEGRALKNGRLAYATDGTPASSPITGGGAGTMAKYVQGRWAAF